MESSPCFTLALSRSVASWFPRTSCKRRVPGRVEEFLRIVFHHHAHRGPRSLPDLRSEAKPTDLVSEGQLAYGCSRLLIRSSSQAASFARNHLGKSSLVSGLNSSGRLSMLRRTSYASAFTPVISSACSSGSAAGS